MVPRLVSTTPAVALAAAASPVAFGAASAPDARAGNRANPNVRLPRTVARDSSRGRHHGRVLDTASGRLTREKGSTARMGGKKTKPINQQFHDNLDSISVRYLPGR